MELNLEQYTDLATKLIILKKNITKLRKENEMLKIKCRAVKRKFKCDFCGDKKAVRHATFIYNKTKCWIYACEECAEDDRVWVL